MTTPNAISLPESASGHSLYEMLDGGMIGPSGQEVARASLSARQVREMGLLTSGTYGPPSTTSLPSANLQRSLENRLRAATSILGSTLYKLTWKPWVTPSGGVPFPSAGVGAPHIRDRLYWVADANLRKSKQPAGKGSGPDETQSRWARCKFTGCGDASRVADRHQHRRVTVPERELHDAEHHTGPCGDIRGLGDAACAAGQRHAGSVPGAEAQVDRQGRADGCINVGPEHAGPGMGAGQPGPTNGYWRDADWLGCRDGKWRPVEPGTFPLAHGAPARVGRLRAYGNAINAEAARVFIEATGIVEAYCEDIL